MAEKLILNRQQSTAVDRIAIQQYGIPGVVLMENAGRNCAAEISSSLFQEPAKQDCQILIGCGAGNNGGDGFVIARHLAIEGYSGQSLCVCRTGPDPGRRKDQLGYPGKDNGSGRVV